MPSDDNQNSDPITLPHDDQWVNDFDFSTIDLPTVVGEHQTESTDPLISFDDLIQIEDPMVLDFECLSGDDLYVDINPVKPLHVPLLNIDSRESWENVIDATTWENWSYQDL